MASRDIERINEVGCAAWELVVPRFERFVDVEYEEERKGERVIRIETREGCEDVSLLSNLPLVAGMYNIGRGKEGVYYEVEVEERVPTEPANNGHRHSHGPHRDDRHNHNHHGGPGGWAPYSRPPPRHPGDHRAKRGRF